jgi:predicted nucleic acid-binding Zn ribbon protein
MRGEVLEATVDSSVWCQQLKLRTPEILAALRRELGDAAPADLRLRIG